MNEYYFNSKKYMFLLIIVCALFLILVVKMFDYLPSYNNDEDTNQTHTGSNVEKVIYKPEQSENAHENVKTSDDDAERHKSGHIDFFKPKKNESDYNITEEVQAPKGAMNEDLPQQSSRVTTDDNDILALKSILNAKKLESSENYTNAVSELLKVPELTSDKELLAMSYDEISNIYAKNEKYNTALSFAIKANKTSPSFTREVLIGKIYYLSGNAENAITRINSALKKGF